MEAIPRIIYDYLADNRRITVAGLGTFLTKGDRESVLFSEFMKMDDGTLRNLLSETGVDDSETVIESFVAQVKGQLANGGCCDFAPMGVLHIVDGSISLHKIVEQPPQPESQPELATISSGDDEQMIDSIVDSIVDSFMPNDVSSEEYVEEPNSKFDVWMFGAIAAGAIALFSLLYGVAVDWMTGAISFGGAIDGFLESLFR